MKQYLPFLTDDKGRSLSISNGVVVTNSIPNPLDNSPEGWESNTLQWARNKEFMGIIKSYTTSLKFYLEGAQILRNTFYRNGMESILYFIWLKLDQSFGGDMKYIDWYKGEPDFSTFKDEWDGVELNVVEGGFFKDLQANKSQVESISFDDDQIIIYMDGLILYQSVNYEDISGLDISIVDYGLNILGPYTLISQDGSSVGFLLQSETLESAPSVWADKVGSTNIILQNLTNTPVDITISGLIEFKCTGMTSSPAYGIKFRYLTSTMPIDPPNQDRYKIIETLGMVVGQTYSQQFSLTITLQANETLLREGVFFGGPGSDAVIQFTEHSKSVIKFNTRSTSNNIQGYRAYDYGNKLIDKVSTGATLSSPLLEPDFNLVVTCGDAIRNLPGAVLKGNFSDFNTSIDAVKCTTLDIVNNIPVLTSRYDKFLKDSLIADLGECSNWSLEPDNDYIFDTVKVGYPPKSSQSDNDVNGKYSFNNTFNWAIDVVRRNVKEYSALSKYFADPYDIELIRVNFLNKDTTTANTDNSIFFLDCEPKTDLIFTGTVNLDASANTVELVGDLTTIRQFLGAGIKLRINNGTSDTDYTILNKTVITTSGLLVIGKSYLIYNINGSDDFSNIGFVTIGVAFYATGTAPTNWTNGTVVINETDSAVSLISISDTEALFNVTQMIPANSSFTGTVTFLNLYKLRRKAYTAVNGIPNDGTIFNLELSPRRCLQNHLRWLRSSFDHLDSNNLIFKSTDKNASLQTMDIDGNIITENANIPVYSMGERVYLPYMMKFQIKSPENLLEIMNQNDDGKFNFNWEGVPLEGFPISIKTEDTYLETQEYSLLATANNNLTLLINNR